MKTKANEILEDAARLYEQRNAVYGDNYLRVGNALAALFPNGVEIKSAHDQNRFQIFNLIIVKLSRYAVNWDKGGHQDSIHDAVVYSAMLEAIDAARAVQLVGEEFDEEDGGEQRGRER